MRIRAAMAVAGVAGLILAGCGTTDSTNTDAAAPIDDSAIAAVDTAVAAPLVVAVDEGSDQPEAAQGSVTTPSTTTTVATTPSTTLAPSTTTTSTSTSTTTMPTSSSTTADPTTTSTTQASTTSTTESSTTASTTEPPPSTTTEASTTTSTTEQQVSVLETRIEVLRLAGLATYDGENFSPDAMSTQNIVLWFWGAH